MKDSGIEWVGEIPDNWGIERIKYVVKIRNENGFFNPETDVYIGMENIKGYSNDIVETNSEYEPSIQSIFRKGDILFGKLRPYLAKVSETNCFGFCSSEFLVFSDFIGNKGFLRFTLLNPKFIENINASTYGAKMPRASSDYILNQNLAMPPLSEQKAIAEYLDEKCWEIDALLADIKEEIETLEQYKRSVITEAVTKGLDPSVPMKESGIDWLGMQPVQWEHYKGKYIFKQRNERDNKIELQLLSPTQNYGVIPQTMYEELSGMNAVKLNERTDLNFLKTIHKGDYCISLRSFQGGFEYSQYEGVVSPAYQVFYPTRAICEEYYKYLFKEKSFIAVMNSYTLSLRDGKNIAFSDFGNTMIPYPPLSEQQEIAEYLDKRCSEIDAVISDKQSQIETLESYKKSLIYEYVTGKKEVK